LNTPHQPDNNAASPARIGPNAITRVAEALNARFGSAVDVFADAGLAHYLAAPPEQMVDEREVIATPWSLGKPSVLIARTIKGKGVSFMENRVEWHYKSGAPLGDDEIRLTKQALGLPQDEKFHVPAAVRQMFAARLEECRAAEEEWTQRMERYRHHHGAMAREWDRWMSGELPADLESLITPFDAGSSMATRQASGTVIQELSAAIPWLVGGSADLAPSNNTNIKGGGDIAAGSFGGRNFHFGVREFGMAGIMNGVALHGGFRIFGGTFLVFADFLRPAIRLASIMHLPVVYVFTHDSIFVGEDGPTHQPVEQLASLRVIPGLTVIRPAEASETAAAWTVAMEHRDGPTALLLTRQNLPTIDRSLYPAASNLAKGAYVLWQSAEGTPDLILMASGSEVSITLEAAEQLAKENHDTTVRVVSFPSWELFERQDKAYRETVLPAACRKRLSVEAGRTQHGLVLPRRAGAPAAHGEQVRLRARLDDAVTVEAVVDAVNSLI